MSDISIALDEANQLSFDVDIQGAKVEDTAARFIVGNAKDNMALSFPGIMKEGSVTVDVPVLAGVMEPGTRDCSLEFVIEGNRFFSPVKASVDFVLPVKVEAGLNKQASQAPKITAPVVTKIKVQKIAGTPKEAQAAPVGGLVKQLALLKELGRLQKPK